MEREREGQFIFLSHFQRDRERKREKIPGGLATVMSTGDSDGDYEGRGGELSTGDPDGDCEGRGRGGELSRSICDERRRGETAICSLCDERRATGYGKSATTTGELSYGDDDDWVFDFFCFGTESVLGFFFFFCFFWYRT